MRLVLIIFANEDIACKSVKFASYVANILCMHYSETC